MKKITVIFSISILAAAFTLNAAQDTTEIKVNTTFVDYMNFIGSAAGISKFYSFDEVKPVRNNKRGPIVRIGKLGLESNSVADCDVEISTQNNFRLLHTVSNQELTEYRIKWKRKNITQTENRQLTLPCNTDANNFLFQTVGNFRSDTQPGIYRDIIMITVSTQ